MLEMLWLVVCMFVFMGDLKTYDNLITYYRHFFRHLTERFYWGTSFLSGVRSSYMYPHVLIQVPVYRPDSLTQEERDVEEQQILQTIDRLTKLYWPIDKLWIQILDESSKPVIKYMNWRGLVNINIQTLTRMEHTGKADNLNFGLRTGFGLNKDITHVVVFDSDFRPHRDWLQKTMGYFEIYNERLNGLLGCVQTRWMFRNEDQNWLTRTTALLLHNHFYIEKIVMEYETGTSYFNGSGGVWLRQCIDDCGGWPSVPFAQDLALSNLAIKKGWVIAYNPLILSPNELTSTWRDFFSQQKRWATGGTTNKNLFWFDMYYSRLCLLLITAIFYSVLPWEFILLGVLFGIPYVVTLPCYMALALMKGTKISAVLGLPFVGFLNMFVCSWGVIDAWLPTKKKVTVTTKRLA